jgi:hypothetical protein
MACEIQTDKYADFVLKLIQFDPSVYKNFNNAARFILQSAITPEQKKLTLHNVAHIYDGLSNLDKGFYEAGKAKEILGAVHLIGDTKAYITAVSALTGVKVPSEVTSKTVESAIDALYDKPVIQNIDLFGSRGVVTLFKQYLKSNDITDTDKVKELTSVFIASVTKAIESFEGNPLYNKALISDLTRSLEKTGVTTPYVDMRDIAERLELNNIMISLNNLEVVEGFLSEGMVYMYNADGTAEPLSSDQYINYKEARPEPTDSNAKELWLDRNYFISSFMLKAAFSEDAKRLRQELSKLENPMSRIKIRALRLNVADQRVERMQELAAEDPAYAALANRNHETYENEGQIKYLQTTPGGEVLSVARPGKEQGFALVGELTLEDGETILFNMYGLDNFVFVGSDNSTQKVDFSKPGHVEKFRRMAVKSSFVGLENIKESDMAELTASFNAYQQFKANMLADLQQAFAEGKGSVDITDDFFASYGMQMDRVRETPSMKKLIEADESLSQEYEVVTVDKDQTTILKSERRKLPFIATRTSNKPESVFFLANLLAGNERIKIGEELVQMTDVLRDLFGIENLDAFIKDNIINKNAKTQETTRLALRFKDGKPTSYMPVVDIKPLAQLNGFADFVTQLSALFGTRGDSTTVRKTVSEFNKMLYTFSGGRGKLYLDMGYYKGRFQLELRPANKKEKDNPLFVMMQNQEAFNIPFTSREIEKINDIADTIQGGSVLMDQVLDENPSLKAYDLATPDGLYEFYTALSTLADAYQIGPKGMKLIQAMEKATTDITNMLENKVLDHVEGAFEQFPAFEAAFKEMFTFQGKYQPEYFIVNEEDGKRFPHVRMNGTNPRSKGRGYEATLARYAGQRGDVASMTVVPQSSMRLDPQTAKIVDETAPTAAGPLVIPAMEPTLPGGPVTVDSKKTSRMEGLRLVIDSWENDIIPGYLAERAQLVSQRNLASPALAEKLTKLIEEYDITIANTSKSLASSKQELAALSGTPVAPASAAPAPTKPSADFTDVNDQPFRIADEYEAASEGDIQKEAAWLNDMLPQFGLNREDLAEVANLVKIDGTVLGMFKDRVIYLNNNMLSKGIVYHEAFHGVFRYLMTDAQRRVLLDKVQGDKRYKGKFTTAALKEFARVRNYVYNEQEMRDLVAEEILADGFMDYMNNYKEGKNVKKGILAALFEMLRKLINMFRRNSDLIDNTYSDIAKGRYRQAVIQSEMFKGKMAFEVIPGVRKFVRNPLGNVVAEESTLDQSTQTQLVGMIVREVLNNKTEGANFDQKFKEAAHHLIHTVFNIDLVLRQIPESRPDLREKAKQMFGPQFTQMRFALGARAQGLNIFDINQTGDEAYNGIMLPDKVNGVEVANDGTASMETVKRLVQQRMDEINTPTVVGSAGLGKEEINTAVEGKPSATDEDFASKSEEVGTADFDKGFNEMNRLESMPAEFKKFISTIRRDKYIPELSFTDETGKEHRVYVPMMVDAQTILPTLLQISADVPAFEIMNHIKMVAEDMVEDGYINAGEDLLSIYYAVDKLTKLNRDGAPTANPQMYMMILDVLHGSEMDYMMFNIYTPKPLDADEEFDAILDGVSQDTRFTMKDQVQYQDVVNKKRKLIERMITTQKAKKDDPAYQKALQEVTRLATEIVKAEQIVSGINPNERLNKLANDLHAAMMGIGLNLPKSLIRMSLIAIDQLENEKVVVTKLSPRNLKHYETNASFVQEGDYLTKMFFNNLAAIAKDAQVSEESATVSFEQALDDENSQDSNVKTFNVILRRASKYVVKYDPTMIPATIYNAEGKPIFRYVKYTPLMIMAQEIRRNGLLATMQEDPFYKEFLKDFMGNNMMLGDIMNGVDSETARQANVLLKTMRVAMFGGVKQKIGDVYMDGKTFKGLDEMALHLLNMMSFLNRKEETGYTKDGIATTIQTYMRTYHQLESSQTNFLVSAMYQQYADKKGAVKDGKNLKITKDLLGVIRQEYERIRKELKRRDRMKIDFEAGRDANFIKDYNGTLAADGKTVNFTDGKGQPLRAYRFNKLADFFAGNPEMEQSLVEFAQQDIDFDKIDMEDLPDMLDAYAEQQVDMYVKQLVDSKVLVMTDAVDDMGEPTGKSYLSTSLLPKEFKVGMQEPQSIRNSYGAVDGMASEYFEQPVNLRNMVMDYLFNNWMNALHFNDLFDGDAAMNVKNAQDMVKRNKKFLATGSNGKQFKHRFSVMNTIYAFVHSDHKEYGAYYNEDEILSSPKIPNELKNKFIEAFRNAKAGLKGYKDMMHKVFDGQALSLLMHQMDLHETNGRLTAQAHDILLAQHYRKLTEPEVRILQSLKIVNNPKKTITAGRSTYLKMSENMFARTDVSYIKPALIKRLGKERIEQDLHNKWARVYELRKQYQQELQDGGDSPATFAAIQQLVRTIHRYYMPAPNRELAHDILNSMEFHQIDHLMDTEASKNATRLPVDIFTQPRVNGYMALNRSAVEIDNKYKFLQVETSGVAELAKVSVQRKMLLPADLNKLSQLMSIRLGRELTGSEKTDMDSLSKRLLRDYDDSMAKSFQARLLYLQQIMREGGDFKIGKVYNLIRESLVAQGAPMPTIALFEVKPGDKVEFDPNLPEIRKMLEYYFFAQYSKAVTDEKGSGFKSIHISSVGYDNILVDPTTGEDVKTRDFLANPEKYTDSNGNVLLTQRKLSFTEEDELDMNGNPTGKKLIYVEAIVPEPLRNDPAYLRMYEEYLTKMFATRIPTEDKRSMVILKVVDYLDGSNLNGIVLPQYVHILAGSDFDVDALYGQTFSVYRNFAGQYNKFGQYDNYLNQREGQFVEWVHYMMKKSEFSDMIRKRREELMNQETFDVELDGEVFNLLKMMGFDEEEDYVTGVSMAELRDEARSIKDELAALREQGNMLAEELDDLSERIQLGEVELSKKGKTKENLRSLKLQHKAKSQMMKQLGVDRQNALYDKGLNSREKRFVLAAINATAVFQVFEEFGLPMNMSDFESYGWLKDVVVDKFQNQNLQASMNIMGSREVFDTLYINEASSVERLEQIMEAFGTTPDDSDVRMNHYTMGSIIKAKTDSSMYKDGIGITARTNKFVAFSSWYDAELASPVWVFNKTRNDKDTTKYNKFGVVNEEDMRAIALIGNVLGMFADAMKVPIPSFLNLNEINTGITLAMVGIGLSPEFAIGFNFMPEIKDAVASVKAARNAIQESEDKQYANLGSEVRNNRLKLMEENPGVYQELLSAGLLMPKTSSVFKPVINKRNLVISFAAKKLDKGRLMENTLTPEDIGYQVTAKNTDVTLSTAAQKVLLLALYEEQAQQSFALGRAGSIIDMFKSLNPDVTTFDQMYDNIEELLFSEKSVFTEDSIKRIMGGDEMRVWSVIYDLAQDLDKQLGNMFLERSAFFKPVKSVFNSMFRDKSNVAKVITGFVGIHKMVSTYPGKRKTTNSYFQSLIDREDQALLDTFTAEYWFMNDLGEDLKKFQEKYPNNKFLQVLKEETRETERTTIIDADGKTFKDQPMRYIRLINTLSFSGTAANDIADDAVSLSKDLEAKLFLKKLYYHELARTGMGFKKGSFMMFMPPAFKKELSNNITEFVQALKKGSGNKELFDQAMMEYFETDNMEYIHDIFNDMFRVMAFTGSKENNSVIRFARNVGISAEGAFVSGIVKGLKDADKLSEAEKRNIAADIIGEAISRDSAKIKEAGMFKADFQTLGDTFTINLNQVNEYATMASMTALAARFNIKVDEGTEMFAFPMAFKSTDGVTYVLQGVDEASSEKTLGENIYEGISTGAGFATVGLSARYKRIPAKMMGNNLTAIGFPIQEIAYFSQITRTGGVLDLRDEATIAMSEAMTAWADEQVQEDLEEEDAREQRAETTEESFDDVDDDFEFDEDEEGEFSNFDVNSMMGGMRGVSSEQQAEEEQPAAEETEEQEEKRPGEITVDPKLITDITRSNKKGTFTLQVTNNGKATTAQVEGYPLNIPQYPGAQLFVHKELGGSRWVISEATTGMNVRSQGQKTAQDAIDFVTNYLNDIWTRGANKELLNKLGLFTDAQVQTASADKVLTLEPGRYVKYNDGTYIITKPLEGDKIQIYDPTQEGAKAKRAVSKNNVTPMDAKGHIVTFREKEYIVTPKDTIVSLSTNKAMQWGPENGDRKAIIELRDKQLNSNQTLEEDLKNLNLTPQALLYLYNRSGKKTPFEKFATIAQTYVTTLQGVMSNEEIIKNIECI